MSFRALRNPIRTQNRAAQFLPKFAWRRSPDDQGLRSFRRQSTNGVTHARPTAERGQWIAGHTSTDRFAQRIAALLLP